MTPLNICCRRPLFATAALCLCIGIWAPRRASAQSMIIAGGQASQSADYGYLGGLYPIEGGKIGSGFYIAPIAGVSRYTFRQGDTRFTGTEPSISMGLGYATTLDGVNVSASLAAGYADTLVSPYLPVGAMHGVRLFAEPQIWMHVPVGGDLSVTLNGGYLTGLESYWFVGYAAWTLSPRVSFGPELDLGGGTNYKNRVVAGRLNVRVTNHLNVSASLGAITDIPGSYHPYVGIGLDVPFQ